MHYFSFIFYSCEWWTKGYDHTVEGFEVGDPLSPYLFLFCAEGLNALLSGAASKGEIHGFSICKNGPKLTHLFFANDCMIFCRSTLQECHKIQELLGYWCSYPFLNTTIFEVWLSNNGLSNEQANGWQEEKSWTYFYHVFHKISARFQVKKVSYWYRNFARCTYPLWSRPRLVIKHLTNEVIGKDSKASITFLETNILGVWNKLKRKERSGYTICLKSLPKKRRAEAKETWIRSFGTWKESWVLNLRISTKVGLTTPPTYCRWRGPNFRPIQHCTWNHISWSNARDIIVFEFYYHK